MERDRYRTGQYDDYPKIVSNKKDRLVTVTDKEGEGCECEDDDDHDGDPVTVPAPEQQKQDNKADAPLLSPGMAEALATAGHVALGVGLGIAFVMAVMALYEVLAATSAVAIVASAFSGGSESDGGGEA